MIFRFSLYGFLKSQQYYVPFILLALLQVGLNYFLVGLLIAWREFIIILCQIPSGIIADAHGRKRALVISFSSYILSFCIFGSVSLFFIPSFENEFGLYPVVLSFLAMFFLGIGEAFHSGSHKAMIFAWMRLEGRGSEKVKIYGFTRSWSKLGSATSIVLASILVFFADAYFIVFFCSAIPLLLNLINIATYPNAIDEINHTKRFSFHFHNSLSFIKNQPKFRWLIYESQGFSGFFRAYKDYLQPVLNTAALPISITIFSNISMSDVQKSLILIGPVYFLLFLLSAVASRNAYKVFSLFSSDKVASQFIWKISFILFVTFFIAIFFRFTTLIITCFIFAYALQNLWRPLLLSRFDSQSAENGDKGATLFSIERQMVSITTMIIAPILGYLIDYFQTFQTGEGQFFPIAAIGIGITLVFILKSSKKV